MQEAGQDKCTGRAAKGTTGSSVAGLSTQVEEVSAGECDLSPSRGGWVVGGFGARRARVGVTQTHLSEVRPAAGPVELHGRRAVQALPADSTNHRLEILGEKS